MKKIIVISIATIMCIAAKAAAFDWQYTSHANDAGSTVYVFWGNAVESFDSLSSITDSALGFGELKRQGRSTSTGGSVETGLSKAEIGSDANFYYAVVNADQSAYWISPTQNASEYLYEGTQDSPGNSPFSSATAPIAYNGTFTGGGGDPVTPPVDVPEPTSGLLFIVGGALLALRRKQK